MPKRTLDHLKVNVRVKIAALWVSATLCYLYGDVIGLYKPGAVQSMLDGKMGFWGTMPQSQGVLLFIACVTAIPSVMIFLSLALPPTLIRWLNVIVGAIFTAFALVMLPMGALDLHFFAFLSVLEAILTGLIVWFALNWPRQQIED